MKKIFYAIIAAAVLYSIVTFVFFKMSTKMTIPAAQSYTAPSSVVSNTKVDNSFLVIKLNENNYKLSIFRKSLVTSDIAEVEKFINDNMDKVEKDKIIIYSDLNRKELKEINLILKKHGVDRIRINE